MLINWTPAFKIGLSLFDFKQLLVDSGIIVHWTDLADALFMTQSYNEVSLTKFKIIKIIL